jgi:hypothetical protein
VALNKNTFIYAFKDELYPFEDSINDEMLTAFDHRQ